MKLIDIHHEDGRTSRIVESSLRVWQAKGWREGRVDEVATLEQTEAGVDPAVLGEGLADGPPVSVSSPPQT